MMGKISYAIDINLKLVTINANPMGTISYDIDVNRKLVTINEKPMGTILNLFIKTGNNYSLVQ